MLGFIDIEVQKNKIISDIGCLKENGDQIHTKKIDEFVRFAKKVDYFCGHNIIKHDMVFLEKHLPRKFINPDYAIDTLFLSALLYPEKPYHKLVKDDKLDIDGENNPLNDAKHAQLLLMNEIDAFRKLEDELKEIYYRLLKDIPGFSGFFKYIKFGPKVKNIETLILTYFKDRICGHVNLTNLIRESPIELAYCLALSTTHNDQGALMPPWIILTYPKVESIMNKLRNTSCGNCPYCEINLSPVAALKRFFGYDKYREYNDQPLQEMAVKAAMDSESLIAVFPTGGGKSITYQIPALVAKETTRGLTVVISPLQSLMKDQVDNLEENSIVSAVYINGLLDPIERSKVIERVEDGSAAILYIAPESLRSKKIEKMLIRRQITRFVIDEAHCFSSWGHDFRVDYLYIGKFIKHIQKIKGNHVTIPVSCFTATAKKNVVEDIIGYFKRHLDMDMKVYQTSARRTNLDYKVINVKDDEDKYIRLRYLIEQENCPTIIYASRTKIVDALYDRMKVDNFAVSKFHGKMEKEDKVTEQDKFMRGITPIMIATSAFGMGVDKKDIGCVIHYQISSSLEDYVQESGRAGRDFSIHANCYILYNENDLNTHFELLNQSKLHLKEIQQVWKAVKEMTKVRESVSQSALEIARIAGWDDSIYGLETRVTTAISTLEEAGYLLRGQNTPRVFANSILAKTMADAVTQIDASDLIAIEEKPTAKRIVKLLISSKRKSLAQDDEAESRVDYIAENLGIEKHLVIKAINQLRDIQILADDKDLSAFLKRSKTLNAIQKTLDLYLKTMRMLISLINDKTHYYNIKQLNDDVIQNGIDTNLKQVRNIINYFAIMKWIDLKKNGKDNVNIRYIESSDTILARIEHYAVISHVIIEYLYQLMQNQNKSTEFVSVDFSIVELKRLYEKEKGIMDESVTLDDIEDALYFMQRSGILTIEGGFMVIYSPLNIERIEMNPSKQFTKQDYDKLDTFYKNKLEQVHVVGEYATKMIENYQSALIFVDDYFQYEFNDFLSKYFKGNRKKEIERSMTPAKFNAIFGALSPEQSEIVRDNEHDRIVVAAGPGSGKTRLLVHKLASILYTEDIRTEQLLMLTFSRAAVSEFKQRLVNLIGDAAYFIDIKTFHSFCFDILGRIGNLEETKDSVKKAVELIRSGDVDNSKITKMILVIDEAQDMVQDEFDLIIEIIKHNDNLRVIAVGDDDQNIYEFRGSNSKYLLELLENGEKLYQLLTNYRSKHNLVEFANQYLLNIPNRIKSEPIHSNTNELGQIEVIKHTTNENLIVSVVNKVIADNLPGKTCIVTWTNEQALYALGLLNLHQINATLIQDNDRIKIHQMVEMRTFMSYFDDDNSRFMISNEIWKNAILRFSDEFKNTSNYAIFIKMFRNFRSEYPQAFYKSDLDNFIYESNLSDFIEESPIFISTFHKTKGKEFDNIYILDDSNRLNDEQKRALYVGITRARQNLIIHSLNNLFSYYKMKKLTHKTDDNTYQKPERLIYQVSYEDVALGYFKLVQTAILKLKSGDELTIQEDVLKKEERKVLKFSKKYSDQISELFKSGYILSSATVKYLVYWKDKDENQEYLIVLPELQFNWSPSVTDETTVEE